MLPAWLAGFDFRLVFSRHPVWLELKLKRADVRGPPKRPLLNAKLTSRLGSSAVLKAYLLECKKDVKLRTTVAELLLDPRRNKPIQTKASFSEAD